jgi:hypothetical protein
MVNISARLFFSTDAWTSVTPYPPLSFAIKYKAIQINFRSQQLGSGLGRANDHAWSSLTIPLQVDITDLVMLVIVELFFSANFYHCGNWRFVWDFCSRRYTSLMIAVVGTSPWRNIDDSIWLCDYCRKDQKKASLKIIFFSALMRWKGIANHSPAIRKWAVLKRTGKKTI